MWLLLLGRFPGGALIGLFVVGHVFGFVLLYDLAWMILGLGLWTGQRALPGAADAAPHTASAQVISPS